MLDHELPTPSILSITSLAIQLNKLRLLDLKSRTESIVQVGKQMQTKIDKLQQYKSELENELDRNRLKMLKKKLNLYVFMRKKLVKSIPILKIINLQR